MVERDDGDDEDEGFVSGEDDEEDDGDFDVEFDEKKLGKMFKKDLGNFKDDVDVVFVDSDLDFGLILGSEGDFVEEEEEDYDIDEEEVVFCWKEDLMGKVMKFYGRR